MPIDKTLSKGLLIMEALIRAGRSRGVSELASELTLTKSNVHRLLQTLKNSHYVRRDPDGSYRATLKVWELGALLLAGMDLKEIAAPFLRDLSAGTQETIHLSVLEGMDVVYIDKIESPQPVRAVSRVGGRAPAYCSSTGKAMLAYSVSASEIETQTLSRKTKNTLTSPAALIKDLAEIRRRGYALNRGEMTDSVWGVAAPIFDSNGDVAAAVGVAGPAERMKASRLRQLAPAVRKAAASISGELGYRKSDR